MMRVARSAAYLYSKGGIIERFVILKSILHDLFGQWLEQHAIVNCETRQQHAYVTCKD